jgi:hypothetical protein
VSILSLFENEKLATVLGQVIRNERPKSDLEKTEWWNEVVCESLVNSEIADFIKLYWPTINPRFILDELRSFGDNYNHKENCKPKEVKIHDCLKDTLLDKKLIEIIKEERDEILSKSIFKEPLNGPKPKISKEPIKEGEVEGEFDCVAILDLHKTHRTAYEDIYSFLRDLSKKWIEGLENFSPESLYCEHQMFKNLSEEENEEKDTEIAEIIFSNFPKTFDYCEKDYYLYICGVNWNFTKYDQVGGNLVLKKEKAKLYDNKAGKSKKKKR